MMDNGWIDGRKLTETFSFQEKVRRILAKTASHVTAKQSSVQFSTCWTRTDDIGKQMKRDKERNTKGF